MTSYEELAGVVAMLVARVEALEAENAELRAENAGLVAGNAALVAENAELRRRLGMDSGNSGTPTSKESIAAAAERKANRQMSQRVRSKDRKPGGQKGRKGAGLQPARGQQIDRTETADPPVECRGCGADLDGATQVVASWAQVWDIPPIQVEKVCWVLPRRRCGCCGTTTTATVPFAQQGSVSYGPNINAAAILLGSEGNVPMERTAMLMEALLGVPVSVGFVARAAQRLADRLEAARFTEALKRALHAEDVLCGDETPVNIAFKDTDEDGQPVPGAEHVITIRTPDERLVLLEATSSRSKDAIKAVGVLEDWRGYFVRDDYKGWYQFDEHLAGIGLCGAHLIRSLQGVLDLHPQWQAWAGQVQQILREAGTAVHAAKAGNADHLDPDLLADLRERYDRAVGWGISTNRRRAWKDGKNHPGYVLASRLKDKADQVWLWTRNFAVPWTNNASERALKNPKLHQKVSGCWHTLATAGRYCLVRSYLISARNHGMRPIDAIHAALTMQPWLPPAAA
jgi:transposase